MEKPLYSCILHFNGETNARKGLYCKGCNAKGMAHIHRVENSHKDKRLTGDHGPCLGGSLLVGECWTAPLFTSGHT